ncbi:MAG: Crp/Fnr family transcriptional regulator [Planctomycetaceae bacterium]|nr:Crp/Fnr family transcriptional regulator [Planctomycetaceae bacterium]
MNSLEVTLQSCPVFCSLIPSQVSDLAETCREHLVKAGRRLFECGHPASHVYLLRDGQLQLSHQDSRQRRAIVRSIWPGDLFGESALTPAAERRLSCDIARDSRVIQIPAIGLRKLMTVNTHFAMDLVSLLATETVGLRCELVSAMLHSKRQRLITLLQTLAETQGVTHKEETTMPLISHQELSEMIGASRETVTTVLGQLKQQQVLHFEGRRIVLASRRFATLAASQDQTAGRLLP